MNYMEWPHLALYISCLQLNMFYENFLLPFFPCALVTLRHQLDKSKKTTS